MEIDCKKLFAMPNLTVGHYISQSKNFTELGTEYLKKKLVPVDSKADIPTGMYACGIIAYKCAQCGHRAVKASIFLPVRDQELVEENLYFENGEIDGFIWDT